MSGNATGHCAAHYNQMVVLHHVYTAVNCQSGDDVIVAASFDETNKHSADPAQFVETSVSRSCVSTDSELGDNATGDGVCRRRRV